MLEKLTKQAKIALARLINTQTFSEIATDKNILISEEVIGLGVEVFITDENGELIPAPTADYIAEDGTVYKVVDGIVSEVVEKEEEPAEEPEVEQPLQDQALEAEPEPAEEPVIDPTAELNARIENLESQIKSLETKLSENVSIIEEKFSKISLAKPAEVVIKDMETRINKANKAGAILATLKQ